MSTNTMYKNVFGGSVDISNNDNTELYDINNCTLHDGVVHGERLFTPTYLINETVNKHRVSSLATVLTTSSVSNNLDSDHISICNSENISD